MSRYRDLVFEKVTYILMECVLIRGVARLFRGCDTRHILVGTIIATNVNYRMEGAAQKNQLWHCRMCRTLATPLVLMYLIILFRFIRILDSPISGIQKDSNDSCLLTQTRIQNIKTEIYNGIYFDT